MFGSGKKDTFCDYVFSEMEDIKNKLYNIGEKIEDLPDDERRMLSGDFSGHIARLSKQIDSGLETFTSYCPNVVEKTTEYHAASGV